MSLACTGDNTLLSARLDGELTPAEEAQCAEHLARCDRCRAQYEALAKARELLRAVPSPAPPADLLPAIRAQAEARMQPEQAAAELLRTVPPPVPPTDLLPAIRTAAAAQMRRDQATRAFWARWRAPAAVAAAAAVLLAVFVPRGPAPVDEGATVAAIAPEAPIAAVVQPSAPIVAETPAETAPASVEPAPVALAMASPRPRGAARRAAATPSGPGAAVEGSPSSEAPAAASPEPVVAVAPAEVPTGAIADVAPIAPPAAAAPAHVALTPRTTTADAEMAALPAAAPSALEAEFAAGVVARMMVDKFVSEHFIESSPTLLSVVTDTPAAELGPVLAENGEAAGRFSLCFTQSMRRALSAVGNGLR